MGKKIGVDLGERRVGYAICDELGMICSPLKTEKVSNMGETIESIVNTAEENNAELIVLGNPLNMNGKPGPKSKEAAEVVEFLEDRGLKAVLWDERLTTTEATNFLKEANLKRKDRMKHIDAVAAQRILESYLRASENSS